VTAEDLYQQALVALARAAHGAGALDHPSGAASLDNPLCGDRVTVQVRLAGGRVAALAHRVRGCLLCEAAAALLGQGVPGLSPAEAEAARRAVQELLRAGTPPPAAPLPGLAVFAPVREAPSRHACVLLPFDALAAALREAAPPPPPPPHGTR
jgi:nitrogen fixation NifU-like protein